MDSVKAMASGMTGIASGASSSYHVASMTENLRPGMVPPASPVMSAGLERKKRGRPRKYKPDESTGRVFSPTLLSSSAPLASKRSYVKEKKPSGERLNSPERKQRSKVGAENLEELVDCCTGSSLLPHVIIAKSGEDICSKIMEFSLQGPRSVCVISACGAVSKVTVHHPGSTGGPLTYEGIFEIITFSGSYNPVEIPNSKFGRSGTMTTSLSGADGRVVGGLVSGLMIAAGPVDVVVVSYLLSPLALKPKKQKFGTTNAMDPVGAAAVSVVASGPNDTPVPPENPTNWAAMERTRNSTADINISLQG